ncbi:MAG: hypothetical protein ABEJ93_01060, partial [Candidatus Nanohalobium sp.]
ENLLSAVDETEDAQDAMIHLAEIVETQDTLSYSSEQVFKGVIEYLLDHREHMDDRALELKRSQDELEEVIEDYSGSSGGLSRRQVLAGLCAAGAFGTGAAVGGGILGIGLTSDGYQTEEMYGWNRIDDALSDGQEESIEEVAEENGFSVEDLEYSPESDGHIVVYKPTEHGYKPIAETLDNDFEGEIEKGLVERIYDSLV